MPFMAWRHWPVTTPRAETAVYWYCMESEVMRMIQLHRVIGRCQGTGCPCRKSASRELSKPSATSRERSVSSRAAMKSSSMDAKPYFWTCIRTWCHRCPCSAVASTAQRLVKASYTFCKASVRMAHHLPRQMTTYWAVTKTVMEFTWCIKSLRGAVFKLSSWDMSPATPAIVRSMEEQTIKAMTHRHRSKPLDAYHPWSRMVPKPSMVLMPPRMTSSFMS
mmetsp:Transcript_59771/g.160163  ORF Transcript_59771/g.160163 Transcript_59771/m.160163 type:complete len:220 (-) Transcript_59771:384-1043(-)